MNRMSPPLPGQQTSESDDRLETIEFDPNADNVCPVIDGELDRERLHTLIEEGEQSPLGEPVDEAYFAKLTEIIDNCKRS